jgi:hypothetical protein
MNYSINEDLFSLDKVWDKLSNAQYHAMIITLNQIVHWTQQKGYCDFSVNATTKKYKMHKREINGCLDRLIELELIKRTRQYQRMGNIPARYVADQSLYKRLAQGSQKVGPAGPQGLASGARVNNDNNHYSGIDSKSTPHNAKNEALEDQTWLENLKV